MAAVCAPLPDAHLHTTEDATATMRSMKLQADTGSTQQADVCYCTPATPSKPSAAVSDDDSAKSERIKSYAGASVLERAPPVDAHKEAIRAATMRHDLFNLVVLGIINLMNVHYLLRGTGFMVYWWTSMTYFFADLAWILSDQLCVKSVTPLAIHHVVSAAYSLLPYFYPVARIKMALVMLVELNTWCLTARRVRPGPTMDWLFHSSWVILRLLVSPYLVWNFYRTYVQVRADTGNALHPIVTAPALQVVLCGFYAKWTVDLARKLLSGGHKLHQL